MATPTGRQALVDQWERTATAFGQRVDDEGYAQLEQLSDRGAAAYAVISAVLSGPILTFGIAGLLMVVLRGAPFAPVMAVTTYAGVILALRQVIAAPLGYLRESTSSATSLASWFSGLDEASPLARVLGALDLFVLWWALVLAVGISVLYHRRARTVAITLVGVYAALAVLLALVMAVTGGNA